MRSAHLSWPVAAPKQSGRRPLVNVLSFLLPPVAVKLAGDDRAVFNNFLLTLLGWIPGIIHARRIIARRNKYNSSDSQIVNALAHHVRR